MSKVSQEKKQVEQLLELYRIYLQMADKISDRRQSANIFFLTINTIIVGLISYLTLGNKIQSSSFFYIFTSIAGMVICYNWYRLIRSYKDLNSSKFKVIHKMESYFIFAPFDEEWEILGRGKDKSKYLPFTKIEMRVPWIFFVLHAFVFIISLPWNRLIQLLK